MLVLIEGGPDRFAGQVFDTADLLDDPLFEQKYYRWTSRVIHSKLYPEKSAQVWQHVSVAAEDETPTVSPIPSATENKNSLASDATTKEVGEDQPLPMRSVEPAPAQMVTVSSSADAPVSTTVATEDYTGEPVQTADDDGDLPDGEQLFLRRKRLKLTVQEVADAVGLKRSRVDAIEKRTAVRGDVAGDMRTILNFLEQREGGPAPDASVPGGEVESPRE